MVQGSDRNVTREEGQQFAQQHGCLFVETSAKTGTAVAQAFEELVLKVLETPSLHGFSHPRLKSRSSRCAVLDDWTNNMPSLGHIKPALLFLVLPSSLHLYTSTRFRHVAVYAQPLHTTVMQCILHMVKPSGTECLAW